MTATANNVKNLLCAAVFLAASYVLVSTVGVTAIGSFLSFKASEAKYVSDHQMPKLSEAELAPLVCPNYFKFKGTNIEPIRKINAEKVFCENYPQFAK